MAFDLQALQRPIGPLPLWAWGTLGGGVIVLFMARQGHPIASAIVNPQQAVPPAPGDTTQPPITGSTQPVQPVTTIPPGSSVYDPNTGQTSQGVSLSDLLGGQSLTDVINKLGPDYQQFSLTDNGVGASVTHSAQNILDQEAAVSHDNNVYNYNTAVQVAAQQGYYATQIAAQQGYYQQGETAQQGYYQNQAAQAQSNQQAISSYYDYLSKLSTTQNNAGVTTTPNAPVAASPVATAPAQPSQSCSQGNFSCIRALCHSGNYSCAQGVASWFTPSMMPTW